MEVLFIKALDKILILKVFWKEKELFLFWRIGA